ncbi:cyclophilin-like domain-containing protein [Xylariales sp. PMI_506]|nr:cyclophilin-like domain-containing protein [Xylariales sp. PMI_506]
MSVLLETSLGDIVIDLLVDYAPKECENFLKLCKLKYYNFSPVHSVQPNFSFQTGDPLGPSSSASDGGSSVWGLLSGSSKKTFPATFHPKLKHFERGTVSMATTPHPSDPDVRLAASQFLVTLGDNTDYLDGRGSIFGKVVEGFDALEKINGAITDKDGTPLVDIRIKHTVVLDDPYPDPAGLREPSASPPPTKAQLATVRIADDADLDEEVDEEAAAKKRREAEARAQALTLEMMGDLPFAEVKPPENVLFVCKLNPVTTDGDLELIFSRFGAILSCEVIRDRKTGDSLQYAFIEYEEKSAAEAAYFKMQGVLIDDRRIHVDFSQSVSKLSEAWRSGENDKRRKQHGSGPGWGGVEGLQKWRKYRNEDNRGYDEEHGGRYGMVYGAEEMRGRHERQGDNKTRGPPRDGGAADDGDAPPRDSGNRAPPPGPPRNGDRDRDGRDQRDGGRRRDWDKEARRRSRSRSPRRDNTQRGGGGNRGRWDRNDNRDRSRRDDRPRPRQDLDRDRRDRDREQDRPRNRGSGYGNDSRR